MIGEFNADPPFDRRPNQRLGVVEAFEESASGSGEEPHLKQGSDRLQVAGVSGKPGE